MKGIGLGLILVVGGTPAAAADWRLVQGGATAPNRIVVFVDADSITTNGDTGRVLSQAIYETGLHGAKKTVALEEFDCKRRKSRVLELTFWEPDGDTESKKFAAAEFEEIELGSIGDALMNAACGSVPANKTDDPLKAAELLFSREW